MLLSILSFAFSARCIQSSVSSFLNQPLYLADSQVQLYPEVRNPSLTSQLLDHFESPTSKTRAPAISETGITVDGYIVSVAYSGMQCQGNVESASVISLNFCTNVTNNKIDSYWRSVKYSYTSPTADATQSVYRDDKCTSSPYSYLLPNSACYKGGNFGLTYSSTMSISKLPAEPIVRSK
jgi:hypothetical protein